MKLIWCNFSVPTLFAILIQWRSNVVARMSLSLISAIFRYVRRRYRHEYAWIHCICHWSLLFVYLV